MEQFIKIDIIFCENIDVNCEEWNKIHTSAGKVAIKIRRMIFQYKTFDNILYLNPQPYVMKTVNSTLCSSYDQNV